MKHLYISLPEKIGRINPDIYGQFSEHIGGVIYGGLWVGEDSDIPNIAGRRRETVEKPRAIHVPPPCRPSPTGSHCPPPR